MKDEREMRLRKQNTELRRALRKLISAVQLFGEAKFMDDDEDMDRAGAKVDLAMAEASRLLIKPTKPSVRADDAPRQQKG